MTKESQWSVPTKPASDNTGSTNSGPEQVQCSHLLVKHEKSRRPSSWREERITRSKSEAVDIIKCKYLKTNVFIIILILMYFIGLQRIENKLFLVKHHLLNLPKNIQIVVQPNVVVTWVHLLEAQCKSHLKMHHLL